MSDPVGDLGVDAQTASLLQRYGFDAQTFHALRQRVRDGQADPSSNRIAGQVEPPADGQVVTLPDAGTDAHAALTAKGREAIRAGKVGVVVLAGGMATRFGGVVKATVDAVDGRSFLDLKVADVRIEAEKAGASVPVYLMTSFATDAGVREASGALSSAAAPVECFPQNISLRMTGEGELFHDADGDVSCYAPGHGDLPSAFARSGFLKSFIDGGGTILSMSNVDNLGATLDPALIGAHLDGGATLTAEVVAKEPGDKGGAPARVDGHLEIVEAFRFPDEFDQDRIPVFNTNTFLMDPGCLAADYALTWFAVQKKVGGEPVLQFERLVGQLTAFVESHFVRVPRSGPNGRFQPVKDPAELERRRPDIRTLLQARGVL